MSRGRGGSHRGPFWRAWWGVGMGRCKWPLRLWTALGTAALWALCCTYHCPGLCHPCSAHSAWRTRLPKPQECGWLLDSAINMKGFFYSFGHSAQITCCENSELSCRLDILVSTLSKQDFSVFSSQQVGEAAPPRLWTTGLPRPLVCTVLSGCLGAGYETIYSTWHISMKYL